MEPRTPPPAGETPPEPQSPPSAGPTPPEAQSPPPTSDSAAPGAKPPDPGPDAAQIPRSARKGAILCHIMALVGLLGNGIGFVLGPLIVWYIKREDHPYIDRQGKEAVNFQLTMVIAAIISAFLTVILVGFPLLVVIGVMMVVFPIVATIKADNGEDYRYPISIRFLK